MSRNAFSYTPLGTAHIEALPPTRVNDQSEDTTATTPTPLTLCELAQTNALPQTDIINPSSDAAAITSTQSELAQTNAPSQTQIEDAATDATAIREEAEILRRASLPNSLRRAAELHADNEDLQAGLDNLLGPRAPTDVREAYAKIRDHLTNVDLSVDANRPKYLTHEWEERFDWYDVVQSKMNDVMNQHRNVCAFSEQQLIQERNQSVSDKANLEQLIASLPLCRQSDYQVDCKGKPLALFMKGGLAWPWSQADATKLLKIPLEATLALAKAYPPPNIRDGDKRHLDAKAERIRCEELSRPHGVYHLGARRPMGHKHQQPTITRESWPNTEKGEAVNRFYQKMAPVDQTLGMLFEVFDKARYDEYRKLYDHWADESALAGLKRTERACWSFCAILMNARVGPHRDDLDLQGGMVCMTCHGDFEGGALILRALGIQYDFQPGDVMFCNASLLEHAIGPWDGQRVSFVNTWKGDMTNVNVAVLPATLTERRQKKATHDAKNAAKEANGDPRCPFCRKWYTTVKTLRTHLNQWAKEPPKADDKKHIAQEVRDFVLKEWN